LLNNSREKIVFVQAEKTSNPVERHQTVENILISQRLRFLRVSAVIIFVPISIQTMAHDSHDDHGHDNTEGSRQYYPKGWYLPLVGLFIVAFGFAYGAGAILGISGTDKWGHKEMCHMEGCKGDCGMDHEKGECCKEGNGECKEHHGTDSHTDIPVTGNESRKGLMDSSANTSGMDSMSQSAIDTAQNAKPANAGHGH
jgi:hypothetical protein